MRLHLRKVVPARTPPEVGVCEILKVVLTPSGLVTTEHYAEERAFALPIRNVPNLLLKFQRVIAKPRLIPWWASSEREGVEDEDAWMTCGCALDCATGWHLHSATLRPASKECSYHGPHPMAPLPA
jgi:hypothetical protein